MCYIPDCALRHVASSPLCFDHDKLTRVYGGRVVTSRVLYQVPLTAHEITILVAWLEGALTTIDDCADVVYGDLDGRPYITERRRRGARELVDELVERAVG